MLKDLPSIWPTKFALAAVALAAVAVSGAPASAAEKPPSDLVGHWSFDLGTETSVGDWSGELQGGGQTGQSDGVIGKCYRNGVGQGFLQTDFEAPETGEPYTVSLWLRSSPDTGSEDTFFGWGGSGPSGFLDFGLSDSDLRFLVGQKSSVFPLTSSISDGEWHHMLLSYKVENPGSGIQDIAIYIDGKFAGYPVDAIGFSAWQSEGMRIGTGFQRNTDGGGSTERDFNGSLDDFAVFNTALSNSDVAVIHGLAKLAGSDVSMIQPTRRLTISPIGAVAMIAGKEWERVDSVLGVTGDFGGSVAEGDAWIATDDSGGGIRMLADPVEGGPNPFSLTPASSTITVRSGASVSHSVQLLNKGADAADWSAEIVDSHGRANSLESLLGQMIRNSPAIIGALPNQHLDFEGGVTGTQIDATGDTHPAFFGGNMLETDLGGPIAYSNGQLNTSDALGSNGRYFTLKLPGVFLFAGETDGASTFNAGGMARATELPVQHRFTLSHAGRRWTAFASLRDASNPAVQQLYLIDDSNATQARARFSTNLLDTPVSFNGKGRIIYATFVIGSRETVTPEDLELLAETLIEQVADVPTGITLNPRSGALAGSEGSEGSNIELGVDASRTQPGTYPLRLAVTQPGSGTEALHAPVDLVVEEPGLRFASERIDRANLTDGPTEFYDLPVESSSDEEQAWSARLIDAGPWVTLLTPSGSTPDSVRLRFNSLPFSEGGLYEGFLEVTSVSGTFMIPVSYTVDVIARGSFFSDPIRGVMYYLNLGYWGGQLAVVSPADGTITKVVPVGAGPGSLAFNPDGSRIYVLSSSPMAITEIDATSLETIKTLEVPGESASDPTRTSLAQIAVDSDSRVHYTDADRIYSDLRLLDFDSGTIVDHLVYRDDFQGTRSTGFGPIHLDVQHGRLYANPGFFLTADSSLLVFDTSGDGYEFLNEIEIRNADRTLNGGGRILGDLNGDHLFFSTARIDVRQNTGEELYEYSISDISAYGDLLLNGLGVVDAVSGQLLAERPVNYTAAAFTPDQKSVIYLQNRKVQVWDLPSSIQAPTIGLRPNPADGGAIEIGSGILRWSGLPLVDGYRIYIGSDASTVAAAAPGSSEDQGVVTDTHFVMDPAPLSGTFYWRVDAIRGGAAITGTIQSFSLASIRVNPDRVDVTAPAGALPQKVELQVLDGSDQAVDWSVSSPTPWISFPQSSGSATSPLVVQLNVAELSTGSHTGTVRVANGALTLEIPVRVTLFEPEIRELVADPNRPVVYGLQPRALRGEPGKIISIDAATGRYIASLPLDSYASSFAVHSLEDRLYIPLKYDKKVQVVDLATWALLPTLDPGWEGSEIGPITAGREGRIALSIEGDFSNYEDLHLIDTESGATLGVLEDLIRSHALASTQDGNFLYRSLGNQVRRIDISTDEPVLLETADTSNSGAGGNNRIWLSVSHDGSRIAAGQEIFTPSLERIGTTEIEGQAISRQGELVVGPTAIYWGESGEEVVLLPLDNYEPYYNRRVVLAGDDEFLVVSDQLQGQVTSFRLDSLIPLRGYGPTPGIQLEEFPTELSWGAVAGATSYRVYMGTDEALVGTANTSSPLFLGSTTETSFPLQDPLTRGFRYYWRVDTLTPTGVTSGEVFYFDIPFESNGDPIFRPAGAVTYSDRFGQDLAPGPGGLLVGDEGEAHWFAFDSDTGEHQLFQTLSPPTGAPSSFDSSFGSIVGAGQGLLLVADPIRDGPSEDSGAVFLHRLIPDEMWRRTDTLPMPVDELARYFGNEIAYSSNQLLIQQDSKWQTSGRVFPYFEWPDWRQGSEIVPAPRETDDYFGVAIAMDGTRALIGAPGHGPGIGNRHGSAFVFEYEPALEKWSQRVRLRPSGGSSSDNIGLSVALSGRHAALGSGGQHPLISEEKVHLFTRVSSNSWPQTATLVDPNPYEQPTDHTLFGKALAIHNDLLFVSAPSAAWHGQGGGVVYPYRFNGTSWELLAPLVPPPGGSQFGDAMMVKDGWLFVTQYQTSSSQTPDRIYLYRIEEATNRQPYFTSDPPIQVVKDRPVDLLVTVDDPDGNEGLTFSAPDLPSGLSLEDLGQGRARITGSPTDPAGTERWIRIAATDAQGSEAVQTALVTIIANDSLPVLDGLPATLDLVEGEDLIFSPTVEGSGPFIWQWHRDGVDIPGETGPSLLVSATSDEDAGSYTVMVTNVVGSSTSEPVVVNVSPADRTAGPWTTLGSGSDHDGFQPATLGRHRFQLAWQVQVSPSRLNPVAIADNRVFATSISWHPTVGVTSHDLTTGEKLWSHDLDPGSHRFTAPSWFDGRVYVQRHGLDSGSELLCLDTGDGSISWNTSFYGGFNNYESPTVGPAGIFCATGSGFGLRGYSFDGSERFFLNRQGERSATQSLNRLFTWSDGVFTERDPATGQLLWERESDRRALDTFSVVKGDRAYLMTIGALICMDTRHQTVLWEKIGNFSYGTPALSGDRLFVISESTILVISATTGETLKTYDLAFRPDNAAESQPLILNDHLIISGEYETAVFDLQTDQLVQTLPHGGTAAYSGNYLVLAGSDGRLSAYLANAAAVFAENVPQSIDAPDTGGAYSLDLGAFVSDTDEGDTSNWSIVSVSRSDVFDVLEIDAVTGDLTVSYNPWESGSSDVTVAVTDSAGNVSETTLTFTVPPHPLPDFKLAESLVLNRQTGLYEHTITVTNPAAREVAGFDLTVTGLPNLVTLNNASGSEGTTWTVEHRQPLAAGASTSLILEYYAPVRGTVLDPEVTVSLVTEPESDPAATEPGLAVDRCELLDDGLLIEFTSTPGRLYEIQYSTDATDWITSPTRIRAAGNRTQWIDRGPPRTDSPPDSKLSRFYRVLELTESPSE